MLALVSGESTYTVANESYVWAIRKFMWMLTIDHTCVITTWKYVMEQNKVELSCWTPAQSETDLVFRVVNLLFLLNPNGKQWSCINKVCVFFIIIWKLITSKYLHIWFEVLRHQKTKLFRYLHLLLKNTNWLSIPSSWLPKNIHFHLICSSPASSDFSYILPPLILRGDMRDLCSLGNFAPASFINPGDHKALSFKFCKLKWVFIWA